MKTIKVEVEMTQWMYGMLKAYAKTEQRVTRSTNRKCGTDFSTKLDTLNETIINLLSSGLEAHPFEEGSDDKFYDKQKDIEFRRIRDKEWNRKYMLAMKGLKSDGTPIPVDTIPYDIAKK